MGFSRGYTIRTKVFDHTVASFFNSPPLPEEYKTKHLPMPDLITAEFQTASDINISTKTDGWELHGMVSMGKQLVYFCPFNSILFI